MNRSRSVRFVAVALVLLAPGLGSGGAPADGPEASRGSEDPEASPPSSTRRTAQGADRDEIDFDRARQLLQKQRRGETLTGKEREYLDSARAARRRLRQQDPESNRPQRRAGEATGKPSVGLQPLTEMSADDRYQGQTGGLYGDGRNEPPKPHLDAALAAARQIQPLDAEGRPSSDGKMVLISVGMSNTTQEFSAFVRLASGDPSKSGRVVIVDGAQGGQDAADWANPERRFRADRPDVWSVLDERLRRAGVTAQQVQVVWLKQARRNPAALGEFPAHVDALQDDQVRILQRLKERFPNLRLAYLSSRIYAGYARSNLNPEPYAYESAFAVRRIIEDQVRGRPELNYDQLRGDVKAPVVLWGPYLWADGEQPRRTDGLVWKREDLAGDGTHPSESGRRKVAALLLEFFKTDPTAKTWFTAE